MKRNKGRYSYQLDHTGTQSDKVLTVHHANSNERSLNGGLELPSARFKYAKWTDLTNIKELGSNLRSPRIRDAPDVKREETGLKKLTLGLD